MAECVCCGKAVGVGQNGLGEWCCPECEAKYPPSLIKACGDPFDYALGLKDGTIIRFSEAKVYDTWVTLYGQRNEHGEHPFEKPVYGFQFYRGIDIKLSEIAWCADAPNGS